MENRSSPAASWRARAFALAGYLLCLLVLGFSVYCIYTCTVHMGSALPGAGWAYPYSDLLINYDQGFVRRRLLGECIRRIANGGPVMHILNVVLFANFLLLAVCLTVLAAKRATFRPWNLLFVLLMPGSLLCMALAGGFWCRKEAFFYTALALSALAVSAVQSAEHRVTKNVFGYLATGIIFLASLVLMFVHEAFVFLVAPAFVFLLIAIHRSIHGAAGESNATHGHGKMWQIYAVVLIILFVGIMRFHGTPSGAEKMWEHLNPEDRSQFPLPGNHGAIGALGESPLQLIVLPWHRLCAGFAWFWLAPLFGLTLYCLTLVALNLGAEAIDGERELYPWVACYLVLTAAMVPLALIAEDWGRWIAAVNLSFLMLWLSIRPENLAVVDWRYVPQWFIGTGTMETFAFRIKSLSNSFLKFALKHKALVVTAMFLFATTCRLPESFIVESERDNYALVLALEYVAYLVHHGTMRVLNTHL